MVQVSLMIACFMLWPSSDLKGKSPGKKDHRRVCFLFLFLTCLLTYWCGLVLSRGYPRVESWVRALDFPSPSLSPDRPAPGLTIAIAAPFSFSFPVFFPDQCLRARVLLLRWGLGYGTWSLGLLDFPPFSRNVPHTSHSTPYMCVIIHLLEGVTSSS